MSGGDILEFDFSGGKKSARPPPRLILYGDIHMFIDLTKYLLYGDLFLYCIIVDFLRQELPLPQGRDLLEPLPHVCCHGLFCMNLFMALL